jgi:DNA-binding MltR family transcriptional regulator
MVRITDLGKTNTTKYADNEPTLQIWEKLSKKDPSYQQIKQLLKT